MKTLSLPDNTHQTRANVSPKMFVFVTVSKFQFVVSMDHVQSIERVEKLTEPEEDSNAIAMVEANNEDIPVYLLGSAYQIPDLKVTPTSQILVLKYQNRKFGILVDRVSSATRFSSEAIFKNPLGFSPLENFLYSGVLVNEDKPTLMISPNALTEQAEPNFEDVQTDLMPEIAASDRMLVFCKGQYFPHSNREVGLGIPSGAVVEIADAENITALPANPSSIAGLMMYRQQPIAIIDLAQKIGLRTSSEPVKRVVALKYGEQFLGYNAGSHISLVSKNDRHMPSRRTWTGNMDLVSGMIDFENITVVVPDISRV